MRPIDADALNVRLSTLDRLARSDAQAALLGRVFYVVGNQPTVDAEPVRHGRWVKVEVHGYCTPGGDPVWACSECGKGVHVYGIEHGTYGADIADDQWVSCPNCGAKMDDDGDAR